MAVPWLTLFTSSQRLKTSDHGYRVARSERFFCGVNVAPNHPFPKCSHRSNFFVVADQNLASVNLFEDSLDDVFHWTGNAGDIAPDRESKYANCSPAGLPTAVGVSLYGSTMRGASGPWPASCNVAKWMPW